MSRVVRLSDTSCDLIESFKEYSRSIDELHGCQDNLIDAMSDSSIIEYMLSYAVKVYRDRYEKDFDFYMRDEE